MKMILTGWGRDPSDVPFTRKGDFIGQVVTVYSGSGENESSEEVFYIHFVLCPYCGAKHNAAGYDLAFVKCERCGWQIIGTLYYRQGPHAIDYYQRVQIPHRYVCKYCWAPSYELLEELPVDRHPLLRFKYKVLSGLLLGGTLFATSGLWDSSQFIETHIAVLDLPTWALILIGLIPTFAIVSGVWLALVAWKSKPRCGRCGQMWTPVIMRRRHHWKPLIEGESLVERHAGPEIKIPGYEPWSEYRDGTWVQSNNEAACETAWQYSAEKFAWEADVRAHKGHAKLEAELLESLMEELL